MPLYDFECRTCQKTFEIQASISVCLALRKGNLIECPKCGSKKVARVFGPPSRRSTSFVILAGGCCGREGRCG